LKAPEPASALPAEGCEPSGKKPVYLICDCGSTTTKVVLLGPQEGRYRVLGRGEAPTTVEYPVSDMTVGLRRAIQELTAVTGWDLLAAEGSRLLMPAHGMVGCDALLSCSSAGGGLRMLVMGAVRSLTAESATRVALGAGAIVSEIIASSDACPLADQIAQVHRSRPDMILLSGGVDGGSRELVLQLAELLATAEPQPRHGPGGALPVIFAGNRDAEPAVAELLADKVALEQVANIRPTLETENFAPARERIHALFMSHVMSRAPGYTGLVAMSASPIVPTPAACGEAICRLAGLLAADVRAAGVFPVEAGNTDGLPANSGGPEEVAVDVLAVDVGGATTDIFSICQGSLRRTVSANLGVSYSLANVLREVGLPAVMRWLTAPISASELRNRILNKMVRPTTLPHSPQDLQLEQAVAREVIARAFSQHLETLAESDDWGRQRDVAEAFQQKPTHETPFDWTRVGLIVGRGGVLNHAPHPRQAALMLMDALAPMGVTRLALDAGGILPQLGALLAVDREAAMELLATEALTFLGTCVVPLQPAARKARWMAPYALEQSDGRQKGQFARGQLLWCPLPAETEALLTLESATGVDWGAGPGRRLRCRVRGGTCGLILDGRDRVER